MAANGARADSSRRALASSLRYSLSLRDAEELLSERGLEADPTTIGRWVQRYGPELEERLRRHLKPTHKSWRVDDPIEVSALNAATASAVELAQWNFKSEVLFTV